MDGQAQCRKLIGSLFEVVALTGAEAKEDPHSHDQREGKNDNDSHERENLFHPLIDSVDVEKETSEVEPKRYTQRVEATPEHAGSVF